MSEDQQSLDWRLKLLSAAPSWQYSQQDIDKLRAEIAMLESMCAHRDAQIVKLRMDRAEIQDEIEQLKGERRK
jgi:septal ring factor EnvC (AmiA/AmiB activator)